MNLATIIHERGEYSENALLLLLCVFDRGRAQVSVCAIVIFQNIQVLPESSVFEGLAADARTER